MGASPAAAQPGQTLSRLGPQQWWWRQRVPPGWSLLWSLSVPSTFRGPHRYFSTSQRVPRWLPGTCGQDWLSALANKPMSLLSPWWGHRVGPWDVAWGMLPDPSSACSLPAWFASPFGHLTPSGRCIGGRRGDRQTDGSCSDVKQRRGSKSRACERPGEQPHAGDRARSTFVPLLMEKLAGRRAERARSPLLTLCCLRAAALGGAQPGRRARAWPFPTTRSSKCGARDAPRPGAGAGSHLLWGCMAAPLAKGRETEMGRLAPC